jgi:tripartite-type tricarboxylate transporter receptor subunit TctC
VYSAFFSRVKVLKLLSESGFEPQTSTPEQFTAHMKSEITKWEKVIRDNKISLD